MATRKTAIVNESTARGVEFGKSYVAGQRLIDVMNKLVAAEHQYRKENKIPVGFHTATKSREADAFLVAVVDTARKLKEKAGEEWTPGSIKNFISKVRGCVIHGRPYQHTGNVAKKTGARTPTKGAEAPDAPEALNEPEETATPEIPATAGTVKNGRGQVVSITIPKGMAPVEVAAGLVAALSASEDYAALAAFLKPQIAKFIGKAK